MVSSVFHTWLKFVFYQLQEIEKFIPKEVVDMLMPRDFKAKYPSTRVIVDATEIEIENQAMSTGHLEHLQKLQYSLKHDSRQSKRSSLMSRPPMVAQPVTGRSSKGQLCSRTRCSLLTRL